MAEITDRIKEIQRQALSNRLIRGAEILGDFRRRGLFCSLGWSSGCYCSPKSDFCLAKLRWVELYCSLSDDEATSWILFGSGEFGVIEAMTVRQWHATKLTALVEVPYSKKPIRVGPRGTTWKTIVDLSALQGTADYEPALQSVLKLQGAIR